MNNFFKVPEMSQNRLIWVGIDLTSVPAKFRGPGTSRTVTITVPRLAPKSRDKDTLEPSWDEIEAKPL